MIEFFQLLGREFQGTLQEFQTPLENPILIFSLILFIILLSPILLKKIRIPGIIGLIIAGAIIGPTGLNVLENDSAITLFSKIGILYIMFIAGLELDMNEFRLNRNKSLLFGLFTFAIPLGIGYPVMHYLLGYDFNASFLTASMFATHTLVAYPIVSKMGVSKNQAVAITVGGTILTDTAVLIILAVIMGNHDGGLTQDFWVTLAFSLTIFSLIIFLIIPRIAQWFFHRFEEEKHLHYIFVLSVVFFAAFLAEVAGIADIIGAFFAGLALNRLIPQTSALMNRIEFIGNSLFIPFFLISVGMLFDIRAVISSPMALVIAGTLTVVAVAGKWLAAWFTQVVFRYNKAQRQLIFGLSGAHAAATLAVILVGHEVGILDDNILNGTIILILITSIIASFATERAGKAIMTDTESATEDLIKKNEAKGEQILIPVADNENIEKLLEFGILIKDRKTKNPISILSVISKDTDAEVNILKARNEIEDSIKEASATETEVDILTTIDQNRASGIARISREIMADMIVLDWPQKPGEITSLISGTISEILYETDKTVYLGKIIKPLGLHKRIVMAAPPYAELEKGFELWFMKMARLSQELTVPIVLYCNKATEEAVKKLAKQYKLSITINAQDFSDWEDFLILAKYIDEDDLIILVAARRGSISYQDAMEKLPPKLEKYFAQNTLILIYPQPLRETELQLEEEHSSQLGGAVKRLGKGIGSIFMKDDNPAKEKD